MAKWKIETDDGRSWTVIAPDSIPEAEVLAFADESKDSWVSGATYRIDAEGDAAVPAATPRNKDADARSAAIKARQAELTTEMETPAREFAATPTGAVTGMAPAPDAAAVLEQRAKRKKEFDDLQAEFDRLNLGTTGATVGGVGGALVGGGLAAALTRNPAAMSAGARAGARAGVALSSVIGGALGTGEGTHLWDIPAVQEVRGITDEEAVQLIRGRMVESIVFDGAFVLAFGPGGRLIGKMVKGDKFLPALKAVVKDADSWGALPDARKAQMAKVVQGRAASAPPGIATQASDALGVPTGATSQQATEKLVGDIAATSGGRVPTTGEMSGIIEDGERIVRSLSPQPFFKNDMVLAETAEMIRNTALRDLDNAGAYVGVDLGTKVSEVVKSAERTLHRETGPVFERAANSGAFVDMRNVMKLVDDVLAKDTRSAGQLLEGERPKLERMRKALADMPAMPMGGVQDFISGLKAQQRAIGPDGSKPSEYMSKVMTDLVTQADAGYLAALTKVGDPTLVKDLLGVRKLYRETLGDLYSDSMAAISRKTPEDVGRSLTTKGTVTEIRDLRAALDRAVDNAPAKARMKGGKVTELSKDMARQERARIDSGLIKGFIEKNTQSLTDLEGKMRDPDFRATLKELLVGQGVADPALGKKVLSELDRTMGVVKLIKPENAPQPGRVIVPGVSTNVSAGSAGAAVTGSFRGAIFFVLSGITGARLIANATATAMTTGNTGVFRTIQRAAALAPAAGKNPAAAEALRGIFLELDAWDRQNGGQGLPELSPAP
jgi:hypothetical protein